MGPGAGVRGREGVMCKQLRACVGWEPALGTAFGAGAAKGGARGEFCRLIPPAQESRNLCLHVKEQNYARESFCSEPQ